MPDSSPTQASRPTTVNLRSSLIRNSWGSLTTSHPLRVWTKLSLTPLTTNFSPTRRRNSGITSKRWRQAWPTQTQNIKDRARSWTMAMQQMLRLVFTTARIWTSLSNQIGGSPNWRLSARLSDNRTSIRSKTTVPPPHSCDLKWPSKARRWKSLRTKMTRANIGAPLLSVSKEFHFGTKPKSS